MRMFQLEIDTTRMADGAELAEVLHRLASSMESDNLRPGDATRVRDAGGQVVGVASLEKDDPHKSRSIRMATTRTV